MDIIEMARRAGFAVHTTRGSVRVEGLPSDLERFAYEVRAALAKPEHEPVGFVNEKNLQGLTLGLYAFAEIYSDESEGRIPVYTHPPQRTEPEPSTELQWCGCGDGYPPSEFDANGDCPNCGVGKSATGERTEPEQAATCKPSLQVQEPVGVVDAVRDGEFHVEFNRSLPIGTRLYTEFVCSTGLCKFRKPLSDEEVEAIWEADETHLDDCRSLYYAKVIARAVERAHGITGEQA